VNSQILARTDGVPLFIEELTKAVLESGLLRMRNIPSNMRWCRMLHMPVCFGPTASNCMLGSQERTRPVFQKS